MLAQSDHIKRWTLHMLFLSATICQPMAFKLQCLSTGLTWKINFVLQKTEFLLSSCRYTITSNKCTTTALGTPKNGLCWSLLRGTFTLQKFKIGPQNGGRHSCYSKVVVNSVLNVPLKRRIPTKCVEFSKPMVYLVNEVFQT